MPVNGARGPEGVGLSKPKRAVKPRRWQQLLLGALRLVYEPHWRLGREPAEQTWKVSVVRSPSCRQLLPSGLFAGRGGLQV